MSDEFTGGGRAYDGQADDARAYEDHADARPALSQVVLPLLKGVLYREDDLTTWGALIELQAQVRDYVAVLQLDLVIDEAEGYAFLRSRRDDEVGAGVPRLVARRPLSFPVSLLLALLRKRFVEFDASGADARLIVTRDEAAEMMRVFLPTGSNEARMVDRAETHLNKIVELGFARKLQVQECRGRAGVRDPAHPQVVRRRGVAGRARRPPGRVPPAPDRRRRRRA
ncbi:MAG: DUF4194 domain-containing protein [Acidimicrobiales bacterium]|nr:DUF4194 domain-containing protein [Acidimicrobiales bacterium]